MTLHLTYVPSVAVRERLDQWENAVRRDAQVGPGDWRMLAIWPAARDAAVSGSTGIEGKAALEGEELAQLSAALALSVERLGDGTARESAPLEVKIDVPGADLRRAGTSVPVAGEIAGHVRMAGNLIAPRLTADVTGRRVEVGGHPLGDLLAKARVEGRSLHADLHLAVATGGAVLWMKQFMTSDDPFSVVHHPWQPQMLAAHVLAAPLLVFALGLIARGHILERFREGPRNGTGRSGVTATLIVLPMIASGYLLQVATGHGSRRGLAAAHWVSGLLFALVYAVHVAVSWPAARAKEGRRRGARRRRRAAAGTRLDPPGTQGLQSRLGTAVSEPVAQSDGRRP